MPNLNFQRDGRKIVINSDDFEIIKLMVQNAGADCSILKIPPVCAELETQGYTHQQAFDLIVVARIELRK